LDLSSPIITVGAWCSVFFKIQQKVILNNNDTYTPFGSHSPTFGSLYIGAVNKIVNVLCDVINRPRNDVAVGYLYYVIKI